MCTNQIALHRTIYGLLTGSLIMYSFQIHSLKNKVIDFSHQRNSIYYIITIQYLVPLYIFRVMSRKKNTVQNSNLYVACEFFRCFNITKYEEQMCVSRVLLCTINVQTSNWTAWLQLVSTTWNLWKKNNTVNPDHCDKIYCWQLCINYQVKYNCAVLP